MNQAFFTRVLVTEDGITGWEYNQPFALLMAAHAVGDGRRLRGVAGRKVRVVVAC
jgi:hypothetical protein